jgi:hypothetical protein
MTASETSSSSPSVSSGSPIPEEISGGEYGGMTGQSQEKKRAKLKKPSKLKRQKAEKPERTGCVTTDPQPTEIPRIPVTREPFMKSPGTATKANTLTPSFLHFDPQFRVNPPPSKPKGKFEEEEPDRTPDRRSLPAFDLRREEFPAPIVLAGSDSGDKKTQGLFNSSHSNGANHRHSMSESLRPASNRLCKKSPTEETHMSPLSLIKRRFSYAAPTTKAPVEDPLSELDLRRISIQATRHPEFSSTSDSSRPVQVTIVDHLPHQKLSPTPTRGRTRPRLSIVPTTIPENDVNEDFLADQEEVLSYLENALFPPPSLNLQRPRNFASEVLQTPPLSGTFPPQKSSTAEPAAETSPSLGSELSYLADMDLITPPLQPRPEAGLYGLGISAARASTSLPLPQIPTELPPTPPHSVYNRSFDDQKAILDELASESDSMRSVVDAINRASSPRSSIDSYELFYEREVRYASPDESPVEEESPFDDNESIIDFTSPILRTGHASWQIMDRSSSALSHSASDVSGSTEFENSIMPLGGTAEKRRLRLQLPPLIISPIGQTQYGPPLRRRPNFRGKGGSASMRSVSGNSKTGQPTLVKVVEEEIVEYTPIEEGAKGWLKERRVSRGGEVFVLEREILERSAI